MIIDSTIRVHRDELTKREWERVLNGLTFIDADDQTVTCFRWMPKQKMMVLPRGAWSMLPDRGYDEFLDERVAPEISAFDFSLTLDDTSKGKGYVRQMEAVQDMLREEQGLVIRPPGSGKTQIVLYFVSMARVRTLVIVHTEDILQQWVRYAQRAMPEIDVGLIRGSEFHIGDLTIATVQTIRQDMYRYRTQLAQRFGAVIADEAHHVPAETWEMIMNASTAKYRFGVTATKKRADGREAQMYALIGPIIHELPFQSEVPITVRPLKSRFYYGYRGFHDWRRMLNKLIKDPRRNKLIAETACEEIRLGNSVLILSREIGHLRNMHLAMIEAWGSTNSMRTELLIGRGMSKKRRREIVRGFTNGKIRCVLATQLADEGLDVKRLNRVFLTFPGKHGGRLVQQVGRAIREYPDKKDAVIYDVVDDEISVLRRHWMERKQSYKSMNIEVEKVRDANGTEKKRKRRIRDLVPARSRRSLESD